MTRFIFLFCTFLLNGFFQVSGQDAWEILKMTRAKCESVQNGHYEMTRDFKPMTKKDTIHSGVKGSFKKLANDSLFFTAFHYIRNWGRQYGADDVLYTGDEFVTTSPKDSSCTLMSKMVWAGEIKAIRHNYRFYGPITSMDCYPLPTDSDISNKIYKDIQINGEFLNNSECFHIQINDYPPYDSTEEMQTIMMECHYWINKKDSVTLQYSVRFDLTMNNDTMVQYEKCMLTEYTFDRNEEDEYLKISSIPDYYVIKDYVPFESPKILEEGTAAPDWELSSLAGDHLSLKSLRGKLVLLDFFYKSCYPCMKALPVLQALNEKYSGQGLTVIGLDPFDKEEEDVRIFLKKRGVNYTVCFCDKKVATDYHVSGYPMLYLIDKNGIIISNKVGFGEASEKELEELIKSKL